MIFGFPTDFRRSKKNTIDLFGELINCSVQSIYVFKNERAIGISFKHKELILTLVFKAFTNKANILLFEGNKVSTLFRKQYSEDLELSIHSLHKKSSFKEGDEKHPNFNRWMNEQKDALNISTADFLKQIERNKFYITKDRGEYHFAFLPCGEVEQQSDDIIYLSQQYYVLKYQSEHFKRMQNKLLSEVRKKIKKSQAYIKKSQKQQDNFEDYREVADTIMAHLHELDTKGGNKILFFLRKR